MRIAITGATGFVGGHLANRLTGDGHEVVRIGRHRIDDAIVHSSLVAQVRILSEGVVEPGSPVVPVPYDLVPTRGFTVEQIRNGLPQARTFCVGDLRWCS